MTSRLKIAPVSISLLALFGAITHTAGAEFKLGSADVSFNSQLSIGSSWRLDEADLRLVTPGNTMGLGSASSSTSDDGHPNFEEGGIYSIIIKGVHDLEISKVYGASFAVNLSRFALSGKSATGQNSPCS